MTELERYRAALETIRSECGHVCPDFELCNHRPCRDSYAAWQEADIALEGKAPTPRTALRAENAAQRRWLRLVVAAWRAERTARRALAFALRGLLAEPYGCPMCDSGKLRNPAKAHWPECPYAVARAVLGE